MTDAERRLDELLAAHALGDLGPGEERELDLLLAELSDTEAPCYDATAATLFVALAEPLEEMPKALLERLHVLAREFSGEAP